MWTRIALSILIAQGFVAQAEHYASGPRGGCYAVNSQGRKRYVDHSLCRGGPAAPAAEPVAPAQGTASRLSDEETARRLLEWFRSPGSGEIEEAVKRAVAKRAGLD